MIEALKNWLQARFSDDEPAAPRPVRVKVPPRVSRRVDLAAAEKKAAVEFDSEVRGEIESLGPGKNVLVRNRYAVEETGTHEMLAIVDDETESGIDPYNTGEFDRSRNWDTHHRK